MILDQHKTTRSLVKRISFLFGGPERIKSTYAKLLRIGEDINFSLVGRPDASTAIFLAGSGRSGTTWLSNLIISHGGIQTIFEPLSTQWNPIVCQLTSWKPEEPYTRSYYLKSGEDHPAWRSLWQQILTGSFRNFWTDYDRTSWLPRRFMVKEIRANLMLGFLYDNFHLPIIFIRRHPCAVIASRLSLEPPWYANVKDLLSQEALVEDYLRPLLPYIEQENDVLGANAVWWAIENLVAQRELASRPHYFLTYEKLAAEPEEVASALFHWLGLGEISIRTRRLMDKPSRTSGKKNSNTSPRQQITGWKKILTDEDQARILKWARRVEIIDYA